MLSMDFFIIKVVKRLVIFMLLVCGRHAMSEEDAPYFKYVDEIVKDYLYEMQKDFGLVCAGRGGCMATRVESIDIFFDVYRKGSLEEARELFVKAQTRLVEKVNAHEKIRPFLKEYPFTRG